MDIIVPAAGLSTRFPNLPPKYLLKDNNGIMMISHAILPFLDKKRIYIGILREHELKYNSSQLLKSNFGTSVNIVILPKITKGPADTVYQMLAQINSNNKIFIKDTDSFFDHDYNEENYICVRENNDGDSSKSYLTTDNSNYVKTIAEKVVISNKCCVGGYKFNSSTQYKTFYENISVINEHFVSHVVNEALIRNLLFKSVTVSNYVDVGTLIQWQDYNRQNL